jgi:hypothetical protein
MITKKLLGVAVASLAALGIAAGPASADVIPSGTLNVEAYSPNTSFVIAGGILSLTCTNSGADFTSPGVGGGNGPVPLTAVDNTSAGPTFASCNNGATVVSTPGWTIEAIPGSPNTVEIYVAGATITGLPGCRLVIPSQTVYGTYTNGDTFFTVNTPVTYDAQNNPFCLIPDGTATFTGTYNLTEDDGTTAQFLTVS